MIFCVTSFFLSLIITIVDGVDKCPGLLSPLNGTDALPKHFPNFLRSDDSPFAVNLSDKVGLLYSEYADLQPFRRLLHELHSGVKRRLVVEVFGGSLTAGIYLLV